MKAKNRASVKLLFWLLGILITVLATIAILVDHQSTAGQLGTIAALWACFVFIAVSIIYL